MRKLLYNFFKPFISFNYLKRSIQLTFIYFVALSVLTNNTVDFFGDYPSIMEDNLELFKAFINSGSYIFRDPAKQFLLYFLAMQYIIIQPIYNFTKFVRFNVLLAFIIEMFFILIALLWDMLTSTELEFIEPFESLSGNENDELDDELEDPEEIEEIGDFFYSFSWLIFFVIYIFCYVSSLIRKYPKIPSKISKIFPFFQRIINSIHFLFCRDKQ